jgi:hypothetical protein
MEEQDIDVGQLEEMLATTTEIRTSVQTLIDNTPAGATAITGAFGDAIVSLDQAHNRIREQLDQLARTPEPQLAGGGAEHEDGEPEAV